MTPSGVLTASVSLYLQVSDLEQATRWRARRIGRFVIIPHYVAVLVIERHVVAADHQVDSHCARAMRCCATSLKPWQAVQA